MIVKNPDETRFKYFAVKSGTGNENCMGEFSDGYLHLLLQNCKLVCVQWMIMYFCLLSKRVPRYIYSRIIWRSTSCILSLMVLIIHKRQVKKIKSFGSTSFSFFGCSLWNKLSSSIVQTTKLPVFKPALINYLLDLLS